MDMLCVAAAHDPIGYVAVNGEALSETEIARLACLDSTVVSTLLSELDRNGVFSRTRTGMIYSRRMVRDEKKSRNSQKNGKAGGNPEIDRGSVPKGNRVRPFKRSSAPGKTEAVWDKTGGLCWWCKKPLQRKNSGHDFFHVDHVIGIRHGGTNSIENLVPSCAECNHARARKDWGKSPTPQPPPPTHPPNQNPGIYHMPDTRGSVSSLRSDTGGTGPPPVDLKADLFSRGRSVLGKQAGGLIAKLLRHFGSEDDPKAIAKARAQIEEASTKTRPDEWIGRVLSGKSNGDGPVDWRSVL